MNENDKIIGAGAVSAVGIAATIKGLAAAAGPALSSAKISAIGATIGSGAGALFGSGVGIATGGAAVSGTIPMAAAGAAIGAWAGPALAFLGIGTAPVWAVPLAVAGGLATTAGVGYLGYEGVRHAIAVWKAPGLEEAEGSSRDSS